MVTYTSIVKGATKIKLAPPKEKYLTPILIGCSTSSKDTQDILYLLHKRLSDSAFTICYKSLIVLHYILNETNNTENTNLLQSVHNEFVSGSAKKDYYCRASESDLLALKRYKEYLFARISLSYSDNKNKDLVDGGYLEILKQNNSLSDTTKKIKTEAIIETIKLQIECIGKLLKNKYSIHDLTNTNDLLLTCFKLLTNDLLVLYNILNEGIITILEAFFELNLDMQKATCELYDDFVMITEDVVKYLKIGKQSGLFIPVIKHITTKLGKSLREHLTSSDNINNVSSGSKKNGTLSAKEQLERVRKQRQLLESQLQVTSNDLSTPQISQQSNFTGFSPQQQVSQQTGTNPFLLTSIGKQPDTATHQSSESIFPQQSQSHREFSEQQQKVDNLFFQQQAPQQTGFQQQVPQQTGFQQQAPQQTGFQQQAQQQTGFQQQAPQQTGFQLHANQQHPSLMQEQSTNIGVLQELQQTNNAFLGQPQRTNNVFLQHQIPTQLSFTTNLVSQKTNNPFFATEPTQPQHLQPQPTKSLNPFSIDNIQKENLKRQATNPFSLSNQPEIENKLVNNNPFGLQNQQQTFTNVEHQIQFSQHQQPFSGSIQQPQYTGVAYQQQANTSGYPIHSQQQQQQSNQGFSLIDL
ncbi:hypothetical protein QEN19_002491 [Hanseniaspora menglaensis]